MKKVYLVLAILGFVVPFYFFVSFLVENGLDFQLIWEQLFVNKMAAFFVADLVITAVVFLIYAYQETKRLSMPRYWLYVLTTLLIGPSFSFPFFLYNRESVIND